MIKPRVLILAALAGLLPDAGHASLDISPNPAGLPAIARDGQRIDKRPLALVIQEWKRRGRAAATAPKQEQNTVGSIVESAPMTDGYLEPADDGWKQVPTVTVGASGNSLWRAKAVYPSNFEADIQIDRLPGGALGVRGELRNTATDAVRAERPITLSLAIPFDGPEVVWLADNHRTQAATGPDELIDTVTTTAGSRGAMSRYPFAAMSAGKAAIATGLPLNQPRIQRLRWDGTRRMLIVEVDVALSAIPEKFAGKVPFDFLLFDFDAADGFRGATQEYYELNQDSFAVRVQRQGQWMPFTQVDKVERPEDFQFAYHEYHPDVSVAYNNKNDILSLIYCEPICQYIHLSKDAPKDVAALRKHVDSLATAQGSQVRTSIAQTADGGMPAAWVETPWAIGARVPTNSSPAVPTNDADPRNSFLENWRPYAEQFRRTQGGLPVGWTTSAKTQGGVIGAEGRCLELESGAEASAELGAGAGSAASRIRVRGTAGAKLEVTVGSEASLTIAAGDEFAWAPLTLTKAAPGATIRLQAKGGTVWVDGLELAGATVPNGSFEDADSDAEKVTGLYIDSFEGWDAKDLNFRPEHLKATTLPLTFDASTGQTAQVNMFHNFEFAAEARERLHERGHILMGNTALYQWSWSGHFLDVLGIETAWGEGEKINAPRVAEMDYLRTMLGGKPYCYLQNLRYENFRGQKVEDYFARCFHYGFWPGFFSYNAAEAPYWHDPKLYNADRPISLKYMRPQAAFVRMGWQPVTLATTNNPRVLVERWGGGATRPAPLAPAQFGITLHNPGNQPEVAMLSLPKRLAGNSEYLALDALNGGLAARESAGGGVDAEIAPYATRAFWFVRRDTASLTAARDQCVAEVRELLQTYLRHGAFDASQRDGVAALTKDTAPDRVLAIAFSVRPTLEATYHPQLDRAVTALRLVATSLEEAGKADAAPRFPPAAIPGREYVVRFDHAPTTPLVVEVAIGSKVLQQEVVDSVAKVTIPADVATGQRLRVTMRAKDAGVLMPYYETSAEVRPLVNILDLPEKLVFARQARLAMRVRSNIDVPQAGTVTVKLPAGMTEVAAQPLELRPDAPTPLEVPLSIAAADGQEVRGEATIVWTGKDGRQLERSLDVVALGKDSSVLRDSRTEVRTDSFYYGYGVAPLNDGVTDTKDLDWKTAAWASEEAQTAHWAEFEFPEPQTLKSVTVFWALDSGVLHTAREAQVQIRRPGSAAWETVGEAGAATPTPSTTVTFAPASVQRLRIFQPTGKGVASRPSIMWLSEVEAR